MRKFGKVGLASVALATLGAGGLDYASPYRTVRSLQSAALEHDATSVSSYIDFPALRQNLVGQLTARAVAQNASFAVQNGDAIRRRREGIEQTVDSLISPQAIQLAMDQASGPPGSSAQRPLEAQPLQRVSMNAFEVPLDRAGTVALRFERRGFGWKVTDVKLPFDLSESFAPSRM